MWYEQPLAKSHKRDDFDCGNADLNMFFRRYARQSHDRATAKTYVAIDDESGALIGFYTLTLASLDAALLPEGHAKRYGFHAVPLFVLARLAVDKRFQGQGLGGQLLVAAAHRCLNVADQVGGVGLLVDAKDDRAAAWYRLFGAVPLPDTPLRLFLPLSMFQA